MPTQVFVHTSLPQRRYGVPFVRQIHAFGVARHTHVHARVLRDPRALQRRSTVSDTSYVQNDRGRSVGVRETYSTEGVCRLLSASPAFTTRPCMVRRHGGFRRRRRPRPSGNRTATATATAGDCVLQHMYGGRRDETSIGYGSGGGGSGEHHHHHHV